MKIAMGNDHTAIELKNIIKEFVEGKGYEVLIWVPILQKAAITLYMVKR